MKISRLRGRMRSAVVRALTDVGVNALAVSVWILLQRYVHETRSTTEMNVRME